VYLSEVLSVRNPIEPKNPITNLKKNNQPLLTDMETIQLLQRIKKSLTGNKT